VAARSTRTSSSPKRAGSFLLSCKIFQFDGIILFFQKKIKIVELFLGLNIYSFALVSALLVLVAMLMSHGCWW
jgi:uncharacterized membrane protein